MNYLKQIILLLLIIFSCRSVKNIKEPGKLNIGLNYIIPDGMYDSTGDAGRFRYKSFLIDKNRHYLDSGFIIAVRQSENLSNISLKTFTETDQASLRQHYAVEYLKEWIPESLTEKKIEFISIQFTYNYSADKIYQRSVYIKYNSTFYIISMSSKNFDNIISGKSSLFWDSIYLVY